ncbi:alpha/beta hydrolase [Flavobacterium sp. SUN046]|uniref:alpha/beta hydrolase family protein n=1 Tax=Flavobacterium sp. SUN046 TaxID=3002440 RepID=UPI002DB823A6|nr:alpha/beta hydrolase [Flavobacterium sp. SUN046]MEC4048543.1 alpha/beta hydrolase [Flavobacterium sp. SUN046]
MKKKLLWVIALFSTVAVIAQEKKFTTQDVEVNSLLKGTLYTPIKSNSKTKLVILIAGSGPTNRSGNQMGMINNSLKYLAEGLAENDIAVYSYDKRIFAQMVNKTLDEKTLRFEDFINDAKDVVNHFKSEKKYSKIIITGHSEGSLIGMVAANGLADGYISLAGAGRGIDKVIVEQLVKQAPNVKEEAEKDFELLKEGKSIETKNAMLSTIFRPSVQPYFTSWLKYEPQTEIQKLTIPILIVNGTKDIQVPPSDATLLHNANKTSKLLLIENMNHIFKEIKADEDNTKSYSNPDLPVIPELISALTNFIKTI